MTNWSEQVHRNRADNALINAPSDASDVTIRGWRRVVAFVLIVLLLRIVYLWLASSWELAADEAHYWEWSKRPDWSYYTKGPGVAWVIWLSTHAFGTTAAAVRLPSAIAAALMTLAGARLAFEATGRDASAAMNAALALTFAPAYFALAQLMTTDVFWSSGWVIATWLVLRATTPNTVPRRRFAYWMSAGFVIGATCLFKYTALFFVPGVVLFLIARRRARVPVGATAWDLCGFLLAAVIATSPIVAWNASRGWPTLAHQIGRLRLPGGDESTDWGWSLRWPLSFVGAQLALVSVVGAALIWMAILHERRRATVDRDTTRARATNLLVCVPVPLLAFYFALGALRQTQGNWAIAGYSTLLVLVGISVTDVLRKRAAAIATDGAIEVSATKTRFSTRKHESPFQVLWHWYLGIGIIVGSVILLGPTLLNSWPLVKIDALHHSVQRISGARGHALAIAGYAEMYRDPQGRLPLVIADRYQEASLLAFYMPGHPTVYAASSHFGSRPNAYDFFHDTDLNAADLRGRDALLVGGDADEWAKTFRFASIHPIEGARKVLIGTAYAGVIPTEGPR